MKMTDKLTIASTRDFWLMKNPLLHFIREWPANMEWNTWDARQTLPKFPFHKPKQFLLTAKSQMSTILILKEFDQGWLLS